MKSTIEKPEPRRPPVYTIWEEFCGWTFDRTAGIPKSQRFTFGQRIDETTLDVLLLVVRAIYSREKVALLDEANLKLEELRTLWRLVQKRGWISLQQLDYASRTMDQAGRMLGGWRKQQAEKGSEGRAGPVDPPGSENRGAPGGRALPENRKP